MNGNGPILSPKGISKSFGPVQALDDVDFEVNAGEVVALVGDNGAGKSTLIKAIAGIYSVDAGEFLFEGAAGDDQRAEIDATKLGIATVYQDLALCDNLDVVANLFLGQESVAGGLGPLHPDPRRDDDGASLPRAARAALGDDPQRPLRGRHPLRRPAPAGRRRPLAARRAEGGDARRADRGARRRPDQTGAGADPAAARARPRRDRGQPQPRQRLRGRRPDLRPAARQTGRRLQRARDQRGADRRRDHRRRVRRPGPTAKRRRDDEAEARRPPTPRRPRTRARSRSPAATSLRRFAPGGPRVAAGDPRDRGDLDRLPVSRTTASSPPST